MIQISYQPAFDPFHAMFRFLRLRGAVLRKNSLHEDHFKILDFYLLFPYRISGLRLKNTHRKFRKLANLYLAAKPYGEQPEDRILFNRMNSMQSVALDTMVNENLIDSNSYDLGLILRTETMLPPSVAERINNANEGESDLLDFLGILSREYELLGVNGLKHRSGLMEYRYDAA